MDETTLINIINSLKLRMGITEEHDVAILTEILNDVISEVKARRRYPSTMSAERINADLSNYIWLIKEVVSGDYDKLGASSQDSHSENGISRNFTDRSKLLDGIIPFATMF